MSEDHDTRRRDEINLLVALFLLAIGAIAVHHTTLYVKQIAANLRAPPPASFDTPAPLRKS